MKRVYSLIVVMFLLVLGVRATVPEAIKYQAIARDNNGNVLANKNISVRLSILKGNVNGVVVFTELHSALSNALGLINLDIGQGTVVSGSMNSIDWGADQYFIKIEMDDNGGSNYTLAGVSQLVSVPYSLYAKTAGNGTQWLDTSTNIYYSTGKVGVGTNNPKAALEVKNAARTGNNILITGETPTIKFTDTTYSGNGVTIGVAADSNDLISGSGKGDVVFTNEANGTGGGYIFGTGVPSQPCVKITEDCMVGIGTDQPVSKLDVKGGDVNIEDIGSGVIMKSPDGNCWRLTVSNSGLPVFTSINCLSSHFNQSNSWGASAVYPMNGNANDISGNNYNGTTVNVSSATDRHGNSNSSFYFTGFNSGNPSYINLPTLKTLDSTDEFSISLWIKVDSTVSSGNTPFSMLPDNQYDRLNAHVNYAPYKIYWDYGDITGSGRVYVNQPNSYSWDHFVFIKSALNNKMQVYKNNVLIINANQYDNISDKNRTVRLGGGSGPNGDQYFAGWMDDVKIFRRALTASEVSDIYNAEK